MYFRAFLAITSHIDDRKQLAWSARLSGHAFKVWLHSCTCWTRAA